MAIYNQLGQAKVRMKAAPISASTLWNSIYSVYNADSVGSSSLKTSLYAAYNGESNANDSFGSNNGTAVGGLTYTAGKIGNAFTGNGTNAYVRLPRTTNQFDFTGDFSISVWFNQSTSANIFNNYYSTGTTNRYGYNLYLQGGRLRFATYKGNTGALSASNIGQATATVINTNTWYHVVITKTTSNAFKMYINGVLQTLTVIDGDLSLNPVYSSSNTVNIGAEQGTSLFFNGKIDSLNTWTRELSASEITELYNSGNGTQYITTDFYKPTTNDVLNTYNGTAQGGLTYGVGKVGTAFQFNGTNAYVSLPNNSLNFTGDFSFSLWMNRKAAVQANILTNYYNGATPFGWWLSISNGTLQFRMGNGTSTVLCNLTTALLGANIWQLITITKSSSSVKMYVDGVLKTSATITGNVVYTTTHYPLIGAVKYGTGSPTGFLENNCLVDAVNIWQKELSASEITELYNSGNGKQYPN